MNNCGPGRLATQSTVRLDALFGLQILRGVQSDDSLCLLSHHLASLKPTLRSLRSSAYLCDYDPVHSRWTLPLTRRGTASARAMTSCGSKGLTM